MAKKVMVAWASLSKRLGDCFQEAVFARCFSRVGFWVSSGRMLMKVAANAVRRCEVGSARPQPPSETGAQRRTSAALVAGDWAIVPMLRPSRRSVASMMAARVTEAVVFVIVGGCAEK